jgi:hypothetical protein
MRPDKESRVFMSFFVVISFHEQVNFSGIRTLFSVRIVLGSEVVTVRDSCAFRALGVVVVYLCTQPMSVMYL